MSTRKRPAGLVAIPAAPAIDLFADLSAALTGFSRSELFATGMMSEYYDQVALVIGEREIGKLLGVSEQILAARGNPDKKIRAEILDDDRYGPVARNIMRLWYLGQWAQLPQQWRNDYGATSFDTDRIVSGEAYEESLVWIAGLAHPMGAKQQGFGAWAKEGPTPAGERS